MMYLNVSVYRPWRIFVLAGVKTDFLYFHRLRSDRKKEDLYVNLRDSQFVLRTKHCTAVTSSRADWDPV